MIELEGIKSSAVLLDELAALNEPVILNFSRGKDSLAVWLELRKRNVAVIPIHKSPVPGLKFVTDDLARYEDYFQQHIIDVPVDGFYRQLANFVYQPPWRCPIIEAMNLPIFDRTTWDALMRDTWATQDTWILDGVRATDSATRRMAIKMYGPVKHKALRQSPIWDWGKRDVMNAIDAAGLTLGPDYKMFGRSFDGIRYDYLKPMHDHFPDDFQTVLKWFPLADLCLFRETMFEKKWNPTYGDQ